jgi:hypothetical protein
MKFNCAIVLTYATYLSRVSVVQLFITYILLITAYGTKVRNEKCLLKTILVYSVVYSIVRPKSSYPGVSKIMYKYTIPIQTRATWRDRPNQTLLSYSTVYHQVRVDTEVRTYCTAPTYRDERHFNISIVSLSVELLLLLLLQVTGSQGDGSVVGFMQYNSQLNS